MTRISLDKITNDDVETLRESLARLTDDYEFTWNADIRRSGFSLHVKVDGSPGVEAMQRLANTYITAPDVLFHLLVKLFHAEHDDDPSAH